MSYCRLVDNFRPRRPHCGGTVNMERIMRSSVSVLARFLRDESGATAIEYGLIAAGISVAIIVTVMALGTQLTDTFDTVSTDLASAGP
jgi:pilus assembly protein Flp/PilA